MTKITVRDALRAGICVRGQKRFFASHGLDFQQFVKQGLEADSLKHIADLNLERAKAFAEQRESEEVRDGQGR